MTEIGKDKINPTELKQSTDTSYTELDKSMADTDIVRQLGDFQPGIVPVHLYEAIARLVTTAAVELSPLRYNSKTDAMDILLLERPEDDVHWPGQLHIPGTMLRPGDTSIEDGLRRLSRDEIGHFAPEQAIPVTSAHIIAARRGSYLAHEHLLPVSVKSSGNFYPVNALPDNFIDHQEPIVERAVKKYEEILDSK